MIINCQLSEFLLAAKKIIQSIYQPPKTRLYLYKRSKNPYKRHGADWARLPGEGIGREEDYRSYNAGYKLIGSMWINAGSGRWNQPAMPSGHSLRHRKIASRPMCTGPVAVPLFLV